MCHHRVNTLGSSSFSSKRAALKTQKKATAPKIPKIFNQQLTDLVDMATRIYRMAERVGVGLKDPRMACGGAAIDKRTIFSSALVQHFSPHQAFRWCCCYFGFSSWPSCLLYFKALACSWRWECVYNINKNSWWGLAGGWIVGWLAGRWQLLEIVEMP